ncbi:MAG: L,D-transpeptidase [Actinobacteria bacterium]|nr:MAG: L,D-transpeptidase [Actinomycetota bacterium]
MLRPSLVVTLLAALALAAAGMAVAAATRARSMHATTAPSPPAAHPVVAAVSSRAAHAGLAQRVRVVTRHAASARQSGAEVLRVRAGRSLTLRDRPRGSVIATIRDRTEFGTPAELAVVARRGRWLGVPSSALPNGHLGWVDARSQSVARAHRISVAVGGPGTSTPTGRFSVTDKLSGTSFGPYYGCCVLALSGHQPHPPAGWQGGDRLAIHGTDAPGTIGTASSAGCLRAADADLRYLMQRVPLGTPVLVLR